MEDLEIRGQVGDYLDYNIINICQNTEKSPGDFRRVAAIQTPLKNSQMSKMMINS